MIMMVTGLCIYVEGCQLPTCEVTKIVIILRHALACWMDLRAVQHDSWLVALVGWLGCCLV
jgi:hypothetical protein